MSGLLSKQSLRVLGTIGLLCFTDFGDFLESRPVVLNCRIFHAILDNMIHLWIGVLTWSVVTDDPWVLSSELAIVALGSSLIDMDHFLAARSCSVHDALHADHRGIFHCTGLALILSIILYRYRPHWSLLFLVSTIPHHLRDAERRGLYLIPFVPSMDTAPLNKNLVKILLPVFPWVLNYFKPILFGLGSSIVIYSSPSSGKILSV